MYMMAQIHGHEEQLIHDVWGDICLECDGTCKPKIHLYHIKKEEIAVLICPNCDFTIVIVEVDKLKSETIQKELEQKEKTLIATHHSFP